MFLTLIVLINSWFQVKNVWKYVSNPDTSHAILHYSQYVPKYVCKKSYKTSSPVKLLAIRKRTEKKTDAWIMFHGHSKVTLPQNL
jgi:hypothetical protein